MERDVRIGTVRWADVQGRRALIHLEDGDLHVGDRIHVRGFDVDERTSVQWMVEGARMVQDAHPGDDVEVPVPFKLPRRGVVYRIEDDRVRKDPTIDEVFGRG